MLREIIRRQFISLAILVLLLQACADKPSHSNEYYGVEIANKAPTGSVYTDSAKKAYAYRSINVYITNDTLIPVTLQIAFANTFIDLKPSQEDKYKVFLLPDSMTAEKQYDFATDNGHVSRGLELFLSRKLYASAMLKKVIAPHETCIVRLGFLFNNSGGLTQAELFSKGHRCSLAIPEKEMNLSNNNKNGIDLVLGVTLNSGTPYVGYSAVSCGQLFFDN